MPMNLENVGGVSEPGKNSWTSKDALLYALGVGAGQSDPTGFELEFTTENSMNTEQRVLPTMPGMQYLGPEYDPAAMAYRLKFIREGRVVFVDVDARAVDSSRGGLDSEMVASRSTGM